MRVASLKAIASCVSIALSINIGIGPASANTAPSILSSEVWNALVQSASRDLDGKVVFPKPASTLNISLNEKYNQADIQEVNNFAKEVSAICPGFTPRIGANESTAQIQINVVPKVDFVKYFPDTDIQFDGWFLWTYNGSTNSMVSAKTVINSDASASTRSLIIRAHLLYSLGFLGSTSAIFSNGNFTPIGKKVLSIYCSSLVKPGSLISDAGKEMETQFFSGSGSKPSLKPTINTDRLSSGVISIEGDVSKQIAERVLGLEWSIQGGSKDVARGYIDNSSNVVNDLFEIDLSKLRLPSQLYGLTLKFKVASKREGLVTTEILGDAHKSTFFYRTSSGKCGSSASFACPTLKAKRLSNGISLSGTAMAGEGDILILIKQVGSTKWKEQAKTVRVSRVGTFSTRISKQMSNVVIRVKQEGTGLFSNQVIIRKQ